MSVVRGSSKRRTTELVLYYWPLPFLSIYSVSIWTDDAWSTGKSGRDTSLTPSFGDVWKSHQNGRNPLTESVCLDPIFVSERFVYCSPFSQAAPYRISGLCMCREEMGRGVYATTAANQMSTISLPIRCQWNCYALWSAAQQRLFRFISPLYPIVCPLVHCCGGDKKGLLSR